VIHRRRFLLGALGALALPLVSEAQRTEKLPRIGFLTTGLAALSAPGGPLAHLLSEFREGLREVGYVNDQNVTIDYRYGEGDLTRVPDLVADLVRLRDDVIVAIGPFALRAAVKATERIPVVAIDFETDPVAEGFAVSLARPGRNVTGTFLDHAELSGKWLQFLKEAVPTLSRVAVVWDASTPVHQLLAIQVAAKALAIRTDTVEVRKLQDLDTAFVAAVKSRAQGVVFLSSPLVSRIGPRLADLAAARRLPTISLFRENASAGCLMAYGPTLVDGYRRLGLFAGRILKGSRPADMPIERPTRFEFVINLKTARALGLTIPPSLLARADQVIE
jgi:ABC-type uncharacterized transport system substrate-binding protein